MTFGSFGEGSFFICLFIFSGGKRSGSNQGYHKVVATWQIVRFFIKILVSHVWGALHHLVPFIQFKSVKHTDGGMLKPATLVKVIFLHGYFSHFRNCTSSTKSCKVLHTNTLKWLKNKGRKVCFKTLSLTFARNGPELKLL